MRRTRCFLARWPLQELHECHANRGLVPTTIVLKNATQICKAVEVLTFLTLVYDMAD